MQEEEEDGASPAKGAELLLEATFKVWEFLEESGFEVDELSGKDVSFIVQTPDGGGRRLSVGKLMKEIDEASSLGEAYELYFLQVVVRDSEGSAENPPWDDAAFPVCQLPPRHAETDTDKPHALRGKLAKPLEIEAIFFPKRGPPCRVQLPYSSPKPRLSHLRRASPTLPRAPRQP